MQTVVELKGVNGEWFTLAGPNSGDRGVYLGTGVTGLYDPPVKAVYEEPGNYPGARYLTHRVLRRDLVFGVIVLNDKDSGGSWLSRESEWRKAWAFDRDCTLYVTTDESGTRYLKLRLFESPEVDTTTDPNGNSLNVTKMVCVASDPFWYQDDVVYSKVTTTNTSFDPNALNLPWPWPKTTLPTETLSITVDPADGNGGLNPTDQYIFPKWTVPGSTYAPAEPYVPGLPWLGAPKSRAVIWTVPDYSFEDPDLATRRIRLPGLIGGLRTEEIQAYNLDGIIGSGTYKINFNGEQTTALQWDASVGVVKAALEALASIAYDDIEVTRGPSTQEVQVFQIEGATGGTFTISCAGQTTGTIPFNASDAQVAGALVGLSSIGLFDVRVDSQIANETQIVKLVGEPTSGHFTLTFDGQTTDPINWNASALEVATHLSALSNMGPFTLSVKRQWWKKYSPWEVSFNGIGGKYKGINVPLMTGDIGDLSGGAGLGVVVSTQQQGSRPYVVKFAGARTGQNVPEMTINTAGLTASDTTKISAVVHTDMPGSNPTIIRFRNALAGTNFPLMTLDTTGLSGYGNVTSTSWKMVEGYTAPAENCAIDVDPRNEQVVSESGSILWGRMNGVRFRHPIPPYTKSKTFEITVSGCVAGQMVTLRLPRPWSRPWGLE